MKQYERQISKEVYDRAIANNGHITSEDEAEIFSYIEQTIYGVYRTVAFELDGKYFVRYELGDTSD